ncbi:Lactam utilization protein LamB [Microbacterium esteraromaticum]|uniref:Lactam utilization protein LamB n=1 Tax=Microbacterium esteraromaticum TaxID=57043 RepID=A0A1R4KLI3_9MICO|nr:5-oxoprolinase subunit PxpA [Microbacterium esteraromaticum]SJN45231.1 Lactam utilization protein LamB [Microbacterium esteraromaticum]
MASIDLNSDLGENTAENVVSDDAAMLEIVTSANVSCGAHAGTPEGISATLASAVARGVVIGAHPSYPDTAGFGRTPMELESADLQALLEQQLGSLIDAARSVGGAVAYVKPHGALYNTIAHDDRQAKAVVAAIRAVDPQLVLLGLAGGAVLETASRAGLRVAAEAFADRAYLPGGALVPRRQDGAVLHDARIVAERMLRFAESGTIRAVDGTDVHLAAQSICVHGDSPGAVAMAIEIRRLLEASGVTIAPFAARSV